MPVPQRGEIWQVEREEGGPPHLVLVISDGRFNVSVDGLVIVLFLTERDHRRSLHVRIAPPRFNWRQPRWVKGESVTQISRSRFLRSLGDLDPTSMKQVEQRLRAIFQLPEAPDRE